MILSILILLIILVRRAVAIRFYQMLFGIYWSLKNGFLLFCGFYAVQCFIF